MSIGKFKNYIAWFYIIAISAVIPMYNRGTFISITQRKVEAFYSIAVITLILFTVVSIIEDIKSGKIERNSGYRKFSIIDISVIAFILSACISTVFSSYGKKAVYGVPGFGMGSVSLIVMSLSYFLISRYLVYKNRIFDLIIIFSVIPVLLVIINRMGYDPLHMYGVDEDIRASLYVSTFGNYGWFCEYMSIILPIGIFKLLYSKKFLIKLLYLTFILLSVWSLYLAGTKTIILSIGMSFLVLISLKGINNISVRKAFQYAGLSMFICALSTIVIHEFYPDFGNGRGYIWGLSSGLYTGFGRLNKMIGVGPNCYMYALNDFLASNTNLLGEFNERFKELALTSAHNEYFDYLINMGVIGLISYLCMLFFTIRNLIMGYSKDNSRYAICLACVISYIVYSFFNFSMVCATPLFFIILGIACIDNGN